MTFDLDLDLEHTLDAGSPVDHCLQVWSQSSHLPARKSDFRSSPYNVTFDLDLEHTLDAGLPGETIMCKFGRNRAICLPEKAILRPAQKFPLTFTLTLSTPWMQSYLETIVCKFGQNPAICLGEKAIFVPAQKCPYHVTFDLDFDLDPGCALT